MPYSHEITERIPLDHGVGLKYNLDEGATQLVTLPRTVYGSSSLLWNSGRASSKKEAPYHKVGQRTCLYCSELPKKTRGMTIHITKTAEKDIYRMFAKSRDGRELAVKKGEPTDCFDTEDEAKKRVKEEFDRIFGDGWILEMDD